MSPREVRQATNADQKSFCSFLLSFDTCRRSRCKSVLESRSFFLSTLLESSLINNNRSLLYLFGSSFRKVEGGRGNVDNLEK